jgi:uncharacterized membrane protein YkvA (DUF1232 family)
MPSERSATWDDKWDDVAGSGADGAEDARTTREKSQVRRRFWPKLRRVLAEVPFAEDLVAAYYCAFDRDTPRHVQVALIAALAYFVLPFDAVADMMPVIGFADDAAVLATAIRFVAGHMHERHYAAARRALARARRRDEE